ncbi:CDI toxin immunity protein [Dictyobacter kobayashii]|uniref:Uncharacterized protein n=1 Tax=Dictyobacter kobayashii TaxID=2014872 RepID=A0A402AUI6_9CHLR|nr:hypothetical protein [Dictyobacter kobayashii]GCE22693.1 hypothetical protein KDK_64930 [Dictyobacter kobayashii]
MSQVEACLRSIGQDARPLSKEQTATMVNQFMLRFPFTNWGRIDWSQIASQLDIENIAEIIPGLQRAQKNLQAPVYIIWDNATVPSVESRLPQILEHLDDVTAVSFDTWLFSPVVGYVIEFYHEGDIKIGFF